MIPRHDTHESRDEQATFETIVRRAGIPIVTFQ
jgi:hypothetical protein